MTNISPALEALGNAKIHLDALWHSYKDDDCFRYGAFKEIFDDTTKLPNCESEIRQGSPLLGQVPILMEIRSKVHNFSLLMVWNCHYFYDNDIEYLQFTSIREYKFTKSIEPGCNI